MLINKILQSAVGPMMHMNTMSRHASGCQPCHAEPCPERSEWSSEASRCLARQTLRGVYTERSECAQGDRGGADVSALGGIFPYLMIKLYSLITPLHPLLHVLLAHSRLVSKPY
jgi:hypothetical protein